MPTNNDPLRDRLLGRATNPSDLDSYRKNVNRMIADNDKRMKREQIFVNCFWIFCVASATIRLWFGPEAGKLPITPFLACIYFTWGGVEIVKLHIKTSKTALLKEIKQLQLHVFELEQAVQANGSRPQ